MNYKTYLSLSIAIIDKLVHCQACINYALIVMAGTREFHIECVNTCSELHPLQSHRQPTYLTSDFIDDIFIFFVRYQFHQLLVWLALQVQIRHTSSNFLVGVSSEKFLKIKLCFIIS